MPRKGDDEWNIPEQRCRGGKCAGETFPEAAELLEERMLGQSSGQNSPTTA